MTNFNWLLDGSIVGVYLLVTMIAGLMVRKYVGKVETFLVAGREMDVYLGIASLAATEFGIVTCMYTAQNGYEKGFAGATPGILMALAMAGVGLTGFVIKPLRDSGTARTEIRAADPLGCRSGDSAWWPAQYGCVSQNRRSVSRACFGTRRE